MPYDPGTPGDQGRRRSAREQDKPNPGRRGVVGDAIVGRLDLVKQGDLSEQDETNRAKVVLGRPHRNGLAAGPQRGRTEPSLPRYGRPSVGRVARSETGHSGGREGGSVRDRPQRGSGGWLGQRPATAGVGRLARSETGHSVCRAKALANQLDTFRVFAYNPFSISGARGFCASLSIDRDVEIYEHTMIQVF
jgi:hypothetical protein